MLEILAISNNNFEEWKIESYDVGLAVASWLTIFFFYFTLSFL